MSRDLSLTSLMFRALQIATVVSFRPICQLSGSDDGMLLVTACEDGGIGNVPSDCAYMNEASTTISEFIPVPITNPLFAMEFCSFDYEGTWIARYQ